MNSNDAYHPSKKTHPRQSEVTLVFKQGFSLDVSEQDAIRETEKNAKKMRDGEVIDSRIIHTEQHTANGEYLVSVLMSGEEVK